ncbi:hypothetical protein LXL04_037305 [Taraxacum kok-saghyz]
MMRLQNPLAGALIKFILNGGCLYSPLKLETRLRDLGVREGGWAKMNDFEIDELLRDEDSNGEMQMGSTRHYGGCEAVTLQENDNGWDGDENGEMEIGSRRQYGGCEPMTMQEIDNEGQTMHDIEIVKLQETWRPLVEVKPYVGQLFSSFEEAFDFYKDYARKSGFEIRKATTEVSRNGSGRWEVTHFEEKHTHDFVKPEDAHFLKSNRRLTYQQKQLLHDVSGINMGPVRAFKLMKQNQGGGVHDGFVPFTGIDNHNKCVTFAAGLICSETKESYKWLLTCFKNTYGQETTILMTDQDPSIKEVIPEVFSDSVRHRYCMWHITQKFTKKLGTNLAKTGVLDRLHELIWDERLTPNKFEIGWQNIMDDFGLHTIDWLTDMYDARESWIPAYFKDYHFSGLMRTTSRSECENKFFGSLTNTDMHLIKFVSNFETAMESQRHVQRKNDHLSRYTVPENKSKLLMEEDALKVFTRAHQGYRQRYEKSRHCLYVLRMSGVKRFLAHYVPKRWTKDVVPRTTYGCNALGRAKGEDDIETIVRDLHASVEHCVDRLSSNLEKLRLYRDTQKSLMKQVEEDTIGEEPLSNKEFIEKCIMVILLQVHNGLT